MYYYTTDEGSCMTAERYHDDYFVVPYCEYWVVKKFNCSLSTQIFNDTEDFKLNHC